MTEAILARPTQPPLTLSEHRNLRLTILFLLYVAQGLPFGLFQVALPAWLAQNGASAAAIGAVLAMTLLPWTLKLFYCFLVDRYAFLAMGRRRPWVIVSQLGIVLGLVVMALANPAASQASLIAAFAFSINVASSMQDVAVDGLAVDVLPPAEIARANGFTFGGQAIGMSLSAGLSGYLIAYHGLPAALLALAVLTTAILTAIIAVRERPGERLLPWTRGAALQRNLDLHQGAFLPIIRGVLSAMFVRQTLTFLPTLFLAGVVIGTFTGMAPIYSVRMTGWEKDVYSSWVSQANLAAGLLGLVLFGFLAERWGPRRMLIVTMVSFALAALTLLALQAHWASGLLLITTIFVFKGLNTLRAVSAGAVSMGLCAPAVAASQFTLFMAMINLGNTAASASLGWLDAIGGIPAMFAAMAASALTGAAFAFAAKVGR
jgi:MFS transporter, PAT family, beta-lactamase induction signal transducer AmpG